MTTPSSQKAKPQSAASASKKQTSVEVRFPYAHSSPPRVPSTMRVSASTTTGAAAQTS